MIGPSLKGHIVAESDSRWFHDETKKVVGASVLRLIDEIGDYADELRLPVLFIGTGEQLEDLALFDPREFVDALFAS